jgi:nicotinamidase-related amidase
MAMVPAHFDPDKVSEIYRVPYEERAQDARLWRDEHDVPPAASDEHRVGLLLIDIQNTFCIPEFELFVAGRSGMAAVEDNTRLCRFIYENLSSITRIHASLDTHKAMQIFHSIFLVDDAGNHPVPMTAIALEDVESGRWKVNPRVSEELGVDQDYLIHYCRSLSRDGFYSLMVWPYHAMLGGIGHALVSAVEEALFFHNIVKSSQTRFEVKGAHPFTENYSVLRPEVLDDAAGEELVGLNRALIDELLGYDALIVAGQAKSHCVAWTMADLLTEIRTRDPALAERVYLLEDCSSAVVVPGVVDFTDQADAAYRDFESAGMHLVRSTTPLDSWDGFERALVEERR